MGLFDMFNPGGPIDTQMQAANAQPPAPKQGLLSMLGSDEGQTRLSNIAGILMQIGSHGGMGPQYDMIAGNQAVTTARERSVAAAKEKRQLELAMRGIEKMPEGTAKDMLMADPMKWYDYNAKQEDRAYGTEQAARDRAAKMEDWKTQQAQQQTDWKAQQDYQQKHDPNVRYAQQFQQQLPVMTPASGQMAQPGAQGPLPQGIAAQGKDPQLEAVKQKFAQTYPDLTDIEAQSILAGAQMGPQGLYTVTNQIADNRAAVVQAQTAAATAKAERERLIAKDAAEQVQKNKDYDLKVREANAQGVDKISSFDEKTGVTTIMGKNPDTGKYDQVLGIEPPKKGMTVYGPDGKPIVEMDGGSSNKIGQNEGRMGSFYARTKNANDQLTPEKEKALTGLKNMVIETYGDPVAKNILQSDAYKQSRQMADDIINSLFRPDTGAAYGKEELARYDRMYMPQPNDSDPLMAIKRRAREVAIEALGVISGPKTKEIMSEVLDQARQQAEDEIKGAGGGPAPAMPQSAKDSNISSELWAEMTPKERAAFK